MRRPRSMFTVAVIAAGLLAVAVSADAGANSGPPQKPVADTGQIHAERVSELPAAMARMERMAERLERMVERDSAILGSGFRTLAPVDCGTMECLNTELTKLSRFATTTAARLKKLDAFVRAQGEMWDAWYNEWNTCVPVSPVTQYDGYVWSPDGGATLYLTTGLDYTYGSDPVSDWVLVWTCGVV